MIPSFHPNNHPNLLTTIEIRYATRCTFSRLLYHSLSSGSVITRFLEIQIYFHHRNITIASVPKLSILNLNEREPGNDFTCDCAHEFKTLRFSDSFTRPNRILLSLREETERRKKSFPGIDAIMVIMAAGYVHTSGLASVSSINFCLVTLYPQRPSVPIQEFADHSSFPHSSRATLRAVSLPPLLVHLRHAFFSFFSFMKIMISEHYDILSNRNWVRDEISIGEFEENV